MRVLLVSNQRQSVQGVGNPIMYRMRDALNLDKRIERADFIPFCNSVSSLKAIREQAKWADVVHVHFGGLYALIVWIALIGIPAKKMITFHGTDIHAKAMKTAKGCKEKFKIRLNQIASFLCIALFDASGFVAEEMYDYVPKCLSGRLKERGFVQRLGVSYELFQPMPRCEAIKLLGLTPQKKYALFSDVSHTTIKRRDIAKAIVDELRNDYALLIMCGVKPQEVPVYLNACDFLLLTSDEEGSPNIIREALALNKPVFSVQVGDAAKQLKGLRNSSIISRSPKKAAETIAQVLSNKYVDNTRATLMKTLDFVSVNRVVVDKYMTLLQ